MPALEVFLVFYLPNWQMRLAFTLVGRRETEWGRKQLQGKAGVEVPGEFTEVDMTRGAQEELGVRAESLEYRRHRRVLDLNEASQCAQHAAKINRRAACCKDQQKTRKKQSDKEIQGKSEKDAPRKSKG